MSIVTPNTRGYNPHTDGKTLDNLNWLLMDRQYSGACRYRVLDTVADAVRQIRHAFELNLEPADRSTAWQNLAVGVFEQGGEPAAVRTVRDPVINPPELDDLGGDMAACGADIPFLVTA